MAYAWFICPYKRLSGNTLFPTRYCAMDDFTRQITADRGAWSETEVLGNQALVKVKASNSTLTAISGAPEFVRIPNHFRQTDTLNDLTAGQRTTIQNKLTAMGYSSSEINTAVGSNLSAWRTKTLRQLLNLIAARRLKPRYDAKTDTIICDGPVQSTKPVVTVDSEIK